MSSSPSTYMFSSLVKAEANAGANAEANANTKAMVEVLASDMWPQLSQDEQIKKFYEQKKKFDEQTDEVKRKEDEDEIKKDLEEQKKAHDERMKKHREQKRHYDEEMVKFDERQKEHDDKMKAWEERHLRSAILRADHLAKRMPDRLSYLSSWQGPSPLTPLKFNAKTAESDTPARSAAEPNVTLPEQAKPAVLPPQLRVVAAAKAKAASLEAKIEASHASHHTPGHPRARPSLAYLERASPLHDKFNASELPTLGDAAVAAGVDGISQYLRMIKAELEEPAAEVSASTSMQRKVTLPGSAAEEARKQAICLEKANARLNDTSKSLKLPILEAEIEKAKAELKKTAEQFANMEAVEKASANINERLSRDVRTEQEAMQHWFGIRSPDIVRTDGDHLQLPKKSGMTEQEAKLKRKSTWSSRLWGRINSDPYALKLEQMMSEQMNSRGSSTPAFSPADGTTKNPIVEKTASENSAVTESIAESIAKKEAQLENWKEQLKDLVKACPFMPIETSSGKHPLVETIMQHEAKLDALKTHLAQEAETSRTTKRSRSELSDKKEPCKGDVAASRVTAAAQYFASDSTIKGSAVTHTAVDSLPIKPPFATEQIVHGPFDKVLAATKKELNKGTSAASPPGTIEAAHTAIPTYRVFAKTSTVKDPAITDAAVNDVGVRCLPIRPPVAKQQIVHGPFDRTKAAAAAEKDLNRNTIATSHLAAISATHGAIAASRPFAKDPMSKHPASKGLVIKDQTVKGVVVKKPTVKDTVVQQTDVKGADVVKQAFREPILAFPQFGSWSAKRAGVSSAVVQDPMPKGWEVVDEEDLGDDWVMESEGMEGASERVEFLD